MNIEDLFFERSDDFPDIDSSTPKITTKDNLEFSYRFTYGPLGENGMSDKFTIYKGIKDKNGIISIRVIIRNGYVDLNSRIDFYSKKALVSYITSAHNKDLIRYSYLNNK